MNSLRPIPMNVAGSTNREVLLVEANVSDVQFAVEAVGLTNLAGRIQAVADGDEALEYLRRTGRYADRAGGNPALALVDIKLPGMSGIELLGQIKADARLKTIPCVMLTSSPRRDDIERSYQSGANAYVVKPANFQAYQETVRRVCEFWLALNQPPGR